MLDATQALDGMCWWAYIALGELTPEGQVESAEHNLSDEVKKRLKEKEFQVTHACARTHTDTHAHALQTCLQHTSIPLSRKACRSCGGWWPTARTRRPSGCCAKPTRRYLQNRRIRKVPTSLPLPLSPFPSLPPSLSPFLLPSPSLLLSLCLSFVPTRTNHEQETNELRAAHSVEFAREMAALPDDADAAAAEQVRLPIELARAAAASLWAHNSAGGRV